MSDSNSMRGVRIRKLLNEWMVGLVALLLLLALLGGWVVYNTHVEPGTVVEEETVATWEEGTTVSHQATVERTNPVFDLNETLREQSHYFTRVSPTLEGEYTYRYGASDGGELDAELTVSLQVRAVDADGDPYWQRTELLNRTEVSAMAPGESATVPFAFNVSEAVREVERVESTLGTTVGTPEVTVTVDTHVTGTVNGEQVTQLHRDEVLVHPDDGMYRVETDEHVQQSHEQTRTVESTATYGPLRSYGPVALIVLAVASLLACFAARYWGGLAPTDAELAELELYEQRAEFEEWLSRGRVPADALDGSGIEVDSLADLVDVAIDTNNRVIEDARTGTFVVLDDDWYYATPPQGGSELRYLLDSESEHDQLDTHEEPGPTDTETDDDADRDVDGVPGGADEESEGEPSTADPAETGQDDPQQARGSS